MICLMLLSPHNWIISPTMICLMLLSPYAKQSHGAIVWLKAYA
jgi:hypothetical protein